MLLFHVGVKCGVAKIRLFAVFALVVPALGVVLRTPFVLAAFIGIAVGG